MKKCLMLLCICFSLSACGAYAPHNQWKTMLKFSTPPDRTDQERIAAENDCIKRLDDPNGAGMTVLIGVAGYHMKKAYEYQDCMAAKGFPCKEECAYTAK